MPLEVEATYENGAFKLDQPLPISEHERVVITIRPKESRIRRSKGLLRWTGDPEVLRQIAEDPSPT